MGGVYVPDASVLLKWVLESPDEHDRDRALALRDDWLAERIALLVPALWIFEIGNILGRREPDLAGDILATLIDLHFEEADPSDYVSTALQFMKTFGVSFYDAVYHAVAVRSEGIMVTADRRYIGRAARVGHLLLLRDYRMA